MTDMIKGDNSSAILDLIAEVGCECGLMDESYNGHTCLSGIAGREYESIKVTIETLASTLNRVSRREELYEEIVKRWLFSGNLTSTDMAQLVSDSFDLLNSSPVCHAIPDGNPVATIHHFGRCICGGDGECDWCKKPCPACGEKWIECQCEFGPKIVLPEETPVIYKKDVD